MKPELCCKNAMVVFLQPGFDGNNIMTIKGINSMISEQIEYCIMFD